MEELFFGTTLPELVATIGYVGIFAIVFVESGIPIGAVLPLPGDTLLFSAGIIAATGVFSLPPLILTIMLAAILGDSAGYWFGKKYGRGLFKKDTATFLNPRYLARTEQFYQKWGHVAIVFARFLPLFRTLAPIAAGIAHMRYDIFLRYNVLGAILWSTSLPVLGYYLGTMIPNIDTYILPVLLLVVLVMALGGYLEMRKMKREADTETAAP